MSIHCSHAFVLPVIEARCVCVLVACLVEFCSSAPSLPVCGMNKLTGFVQNERAGCICRHANESDICMGDAVYGNFEPSSTWLHKGYQRDYFTILCLPSADNLFVRFAFPADYPGCDARSPGYCDPGNGNRPCCAGVCAKANSHRFFRRGFGCCCLLLSLFIFVACRSARLLVVPGLLCLRRIRTNSGASRIATNASCAKLTHNAIDGLC